MRWPTLSARAWKVALCVIALCASSFWLTEIWYAPRTLAPGAAGSLGITYHELPRWGRSSYVIDELAADSPLLAVGARPGDLWIPDRPYDAQRRLGAHERIGLTLVQGDSSRHVTVDTTPDPMPTDVWLYVTGWGISLFGLVVGLLVGFRQPNGTAYRALALFMICMAAFKAIPTYLILPAGGPFLAHHLLWGPGYTLNGVLLLVFYLSFPGDRVHETGFRGWLRRYAVPLAAALLLISAVAVVVRAIGYYVPLLRALLIVATAAFVLAALAVLWDNWRSSRGDERERHLWILLAFSTLTVGPPAVVALRGLAENADWMARHWWIARSTTLVALLTFSYAVLRHRVVSIGFAINRAMVYGAASFGVLLSFGVFEWLAHHFLEFAGRERSMWLDAAIALGIFLIFHRLRDSGEKLIERLFFQTWHAKEEALRRFVREAPFITRPESLLTAYTAALDRFTGGARHALYRRTADGQYERVAATLDSAPEHVDADEPLAVALRAQQQPTHVSDTYSTVPGELALPSIHHGELDGFVVLGPKPNGETYRPDEIEVLGFAAHQVGLDFRALRMEQLEQEVRSLRARVGELATAGPAIATTAEC